MAPRSCAQIMRPDHAPSPDPPRCAQIRRDEASILSLSLPLSLSLSPSPPPPPLGRRRPPLPRAECRGVRREGQRHRRRLEDVRESPRFAEMSPRCRREITASTVPWGMVTRLRFGLTSSSAASASQRRLGRACRWEHRCLTVGATGSGRRLRFRWRSRLSAGSTRCAPSPSCLRSRARDRRDRPPRDRRETASHPFAPPGVDRRQAAAAPRLVRKQRRRRKGPRGHRQRPPRASHPPAGCRPSPRPSPDHFP